jgi:hypothetical protein
MQQLRPDSCALQALEESGPKQYRVLALSGSALRDAGGFKQLQLSSSGVSDKSVGKRWALRPFKLLEPLQYWRLKIWNCSNFNPLEPIRVLELFQAVRIIADAETLYSSFQASFSFRWEPNP